MREEELTHHMLRIKNFLKEIWDKHFEFQVQELNQNVDNLLEQVQTLPYKSE